MDCEYLVYVKLLIKTSLIIICIIHAFETHSLTQSWTNKATKICHCILLRFFMSLFQNSCEIIFIITLRRF